MLLSNAKLQVCTHNCRFGPFRSHQCSWCDQHLLKATCIPEKDFLQCSQLRSKQCSLSAVMYAYLALAHSQGCIQGWKSGYLVLQFQFRCVETQMSGFSFGLVLWLSKNRFQFRFQFGLGTASVSGFQFRFKFHPRKLFYFEYKLLFKCSTSWHICFITISSSSRGRVSRAVYCLKGCRLGYTSEVVDA